MYPPAVFYRDMVLSGKTLGIIGFGRIGQAVAKKAYGLGMKIVFYQPVPAPGEAVAAVEAKAVSWRNSLRPRMWSPFTYPSQRRPATTSTEKSWR